MYPNVRKYTVHGYYAYFLYTSLKLNMGSQHLPTQPCCIWISPLFLHSIIFVASYIPYLVWFPVCDLALPHNLRSLKRSGEKCEEKSHGFFLSPYVGVEAMGCKSIRHLLQASGRFQKTGETARWSVSKTLREDGCESSLNQDIRPYSEGCLWHWGGGGVVSKMFYVHPEDWWIF